jgi:organic hydroperoxide reductase OsmC/OhrA
MSTYTATIRWSRTGEGDFTKGQYSRAHEWSFDGGAVVPASASPHIVPTPWSDAAGVDPEEAFVASLSSCHMLFFLDFARRQGFTIDEYADEAEGVLEKRADGKMAMTKVTLHPRITFSGEKRPGDADIADLHHRAHEACFIANSVTTEVRVGY